jgi:hypothetical protein
MREHHTWLDSGLTLKYWTSWKGWPGTNALAYSVAKKKVSKRCHVVEMSKNFFVCVSDVPGKGVRVFLLQSPNINNLA